MHGNQTPRYSEARPHGGMTSKPRTMGSPALEVKGILTTEAVLCAKATQPPDAQSPLNCEARPHGGMGCKPRTMGRPPQKVNVVHMMLARRGKCAPKCLRSRAGSCTQRRLPEKLSVCREEANIRLPVPDHGQVTRDTERGIPNRGQFARTVPTT